MTEWATILIAVIVGAVISCGFLLLVEYLRHRWKLSERYKDLLAERQLSVCNKLSKMLFDFVSDLSPASHGVEPLRWPKDRRITPNPPREAVEHAQRINQQLTELTYYIATNEMILGPGIVRVWNRYYGALMQIKQTVSTSNQRDTAAIATLDKLLTEFTDKMSEAIQEELQGINIKFVSSKEVKEIRKEGIELAKKLLTQTEAEVNKRMNSQVPAAKP